MVSKEEENSAINNNLTDSLQADNGQQFQFAYDTESGKYGFKAKVEGADTFVPFSSSGVKRVIYANHIGIQYAPFTTSYTFTEDIEGYLLAQWQSGPANNYIYESDITIQGVTYEVIDKRFESPNNKAVYKISAKSGDVISLISQTTYAYTTLIFMIAE